MNNIISSLVSRRSPCYFISPHPDDAILSAGCLMRYLVKKGVPVTVINVFTSAGTNPQTLSAQKFVRLSGYAHPQSLYLARKSEDSRALTHLGAQVTNLDYIDALWRKNPRPGPLARFLEPFVPELTHLYPTFRWHVISGRTSPLDQSLIRALAAQLKKMISSRSAVVFCPQGVGGHVDHLVVRQAVEIHFRPILWLDQPYSQSQSPPHAGFNFPLRQVYKNSLLRLYKTQFAPMFPSGKTPLLEERFTYVH